MRVTLPWLFWLAWLTAGMANASEPQFYRSEDTARNNLPFSDAVVVGDMIILSGAIGFDAKAGKLVSGGIEPETRQMFANIAATLAALDAGLENIVKCTVMLADINEWPAFNSIYVTYFEGNMPARSAFGANGLALGARVEMECLATRLQ